MKRKGIPEFLKDVIKVRLDRLQNTRVSSDVAGNLSKAVLREVVEMRQHRIAILQPSQSETHFNQLTNTQTNWIGGDCETHMVCCMRLREWRSLELTRVFNSRQISSDSRFPSLTTFLLCLYLFLLLLRYHRKTHRFIITKLGLWVQFVMLLDLDHVRS